MIVGPSESLYRYGYYLFNFEFPREYPYAPPKVYYLTNDGSTRFNPNLYRNGKVCISILNIEKENNGLLSIYPFRIFNIIIVIS